MDSQTNYPDNLSELESTQDGDTWQQNEASAETEAKPERQRERKVLLVDPNSSDLELMKKAILSQSPLYDVLACLTAADALTMAQAGSIDVIVTNNELPGESFDEFLSALMRLLPYSPIIVTTAKDSPELALKLLLAGVSDYLPKFGEFQRFLPRTITTNLQRAIIIENLKEMYDKVEQSSRDEALLNRFIVNIHGSLDLADIVDRATQSLLEEFNATRAVICQLSEPENIMRITRQCTRNDQPAISDKSTIFGKYHDLLLDVGERRPLVVVQDDTYAFARDVRAEMQIYHIRSMVMVPLMYRGRLTGLIHLDEKRETRLWNTRDINILVRIASQLSIALSQAKLYQIVEAQSNSISKLSELCSQLNQVVKNTTELTERTESREKVRIKLSTREIEVLKKVAQGLSNREIAEQLHITEGTTEVHVSRLRKKLNLSTRAALVRYAYENHLS